MSKASKKFKNRKRRAKKVEVQNPWGFKFTDDDLFGLHEGAVGMLGLVILEKAQKEGWTEEQTIKQIKMAEPLAKSLATFNLSSIYLTPYPTTEERVGKYGYLQTKGSLDISGDIGEVK